MNDLDLSKKPSIRVDVIWIWMNEDLRSRFFQVKRIDFFTLSINDGTFYQHYLFVYYNVSFF